MQIAIPRPLKKLHLHRRRPRRLTLRPERRIVRLRELFFLKPFSIFGPDFHKAKGARILGILEDVHG